MVSWRTLQICSDETLDTILYRLVTRLTSLKSEFYWFVSFWHKSNESCIGVLVDNSIIVKL